MAAERIPPLPQPSVSPQDLACRTIERRAIDAAIWGMPIVSVNAMRPSAG
jgi:hypothetical protein